MKDKRNKPEQIITKLRVAEVELAKGQSVEAMVRKLGIPERTSIMTATWRASIF